MKPSGQSVIPNQASTIVAMTRFNWRELVSGRRADARSVTDREWLIPVTAIVAVEMLLWTAAYLGGLAHAPLFKPFGLVALAFFVVVVVAQLMGILIRLQREGERQPLRRVTELMRDNGRRILSAALGLQVLTLGSAAFAALKAGIPKAVPFWMDVPLANVEQSLFGVAPWQLSHALFAWATPFIDHFYASFVPVYLLIVLAMLASPPSRLKSQALITLALCWLCLGICGAYLLSSAGPLFYDRLYGGQRFAVLLEDIRTTAPLANIELDVLWSAFKGDREIMVNGISAMPSMHVSITLWLALILKDTRAAAIGWAYYGLTWFSSVHLGWHYFSDGLVATIGTLALWRLTGLGLDGAALYPVKSQKSRS